MAKLIVQKVSGSTLIEVLISMVIIMAVFVAGIAIYTKVTQSGFSMSRTEAQQHMQRILEESIAGKDWEEEVIMQDSISYTKSVSPYEGYSDLIQIKIEAEQNGTGLGTLRQIVKKDKTNILSQ